MLFFLNINNQRVQRGSAYGPGASRNASWPLQPSLRENLTRLKKWREN